MTPTKTWPLIGAALGGLAVVLGAFAAHGLHDMLAANDRLDTWELAARYQMYHALALVAMGWLGRERSGVMLNVTGTCFTLGAVIFSGSLYVLAATNIGWLGAITPVGGTLLIVGWVCLVITVYRSR